LPSKEDAEVDTLARVHGKNPFGRNAEEIQSIEQLLGKKIATLPKETEKRVVLFSCFSIRWKDGTKCHRGD
jgi:hypothetical protein